MKIKYLAVCFIGFFYTCSAQKQGVLTQGLQGTVYLLQGNQMPVIGRPQSKGKPVSREIYIYEPVTIAQTQGNSPLFSGIKTKLIAHTKSDDKGNYAVSLPAGRYSIFVKEGNNFFAAISDADGTLNPAIVKVKNISKKDIEITLNATF